MSSSEDNAKGIGLVVDADADETEISVIDANFHRVGSGIGSLTISLPPGIYDLNFQAGSLIKRVPIVLQRPQDQVHVRGPLMDFSSSAPLAVTRTNHEYHEYPAEALSKQAHKVLGEGSQIFLFVRELESSSVGDIAAGISLHTVDGKAVFDFSGQRAESDGSGTWYRRAAESNGHPYAGYTIGVKPGTYRLRVRISDSDSLEQSVVAVQGWQTQLFMSLRDYVPGSCGRYADLTHMSVFIAALGVGFNPRSKESRLSELSRQGLEDTRDVMAKTLRNTLRSGIRDPMFGIYAAHLLLRSPEPDLAALSDVTGSLCSLVGDIPDVRSLSAYLSARLGREEDLAPFDEPPMLRSSWDIVVRATASKPSLVPRNSLASQISGRLWGSGPWLVWLCSSEMRTGRSPANALGTSLLETDLNTENALVNSLSRMDLEAAGNMASGLGNVQAHRNELVRSSEETGLTAEEREALRYVLDVTRTRASTDRPAQRFSESSQSSEPERLNPVNERLSPTKVVQSLGVPAEAASDALGGMFRKMGIALAISGSGYRGTLFALGSLWRLNEFGLLPRIARVTSVSGGSILSGLLGLKWKELSFDTMGVAANFEDTIAAPIRALCQRNLDLPAYLSGFLPGGKSAGDRLADGYCKWLFGSSSLQDLPSPGEGPEFLFYATSLQTGNGVRMSKKYIADYVIGMWPDPKVLLGQVVAASGALPPACSPVNIRCVPDDWSQTQGAFLYSDPEYRRRLVLTDGSIDNNMALEGAWNDKFGTVLVCDGSVDRLAASARPGKSYFAQIIRIWNINRSKMGVLAKRLLIDSYTSSDQASGEGGTYWAMGTAIDNYRLEDAMTRDNSLTRSLMLMRVRLARYSATEQGRLINWGYALADAAVRKFYLKDKHPPGRWPIPECALDA